MRLVTLGKQTITRCTVSAGVKNLSVDNASYNILTKM